MKINMNSIFENFDFLYEKGELKVLNDDLILDEITKKEYDRLEFCDILIEFLEHKIQQEGDNPDLESLNTFNTEIEKLQTIKKNILSENENEELIKELKNYIEEDFKIIKELASYIEKNNICSSMKEFYNIDFDIMIETISELTEYNFLVTESNELINKFTILNTNIFEGLELVKKNNVVMYFFTEKQAERYADFHTDSYKIIKLD